METIKIGHVSAIPKNFTGIAEFLGGTKFWYKEGLYHRLDGPAIEYPNGIKTWYKKGKRHRLDGPAYEDVNGTKEWWIEGKFYSEENFNKKIQEMNQSKEPKMETIKVRYTTEIPKNFTGFAEFLSGTKCWYKERKYHRLDGPACEYSNGDKEWMIEGKFHRLDGPAIERANGDKLWFKEGELHRLDGPAVELVDGRDRWFIEGGEYTKENFDKKIQELKKSANNCASSSLQVPLTGLSCVANNTVQAASVPQTGEPKMSKSQKVLEIAKSDAAIVAKRVAVQQVSKIIQNLIVEAMSSGKKGKQKTAFKSNLEEFFSSETGKAILQFASGLLLPQLAKYAQQYNLLKPQHLFVVDFLAEEMRIQGETTVALQAIEAVTPLVSMLTSGLTSQMSSFFSSVEESVEPVRIALEAGDSNSSVHEEFVSNAATKVAAMG
jgi:hypothetical protein